jgi:hypothetical protein
MFRGFDAKIPTEYEVPGSMFHECCQHWKENALWLHYHTYVHVVHYRFFTDERELILRTRIVAELLDQGCFFTNPDLRVFAIKVSYDENHMDLNTPELSLRFSCVKWIYSRFHTGNRLQFELITFQAMVGARSRSRKRNDCGGQMEFVGGDG